jgi:hypothetical protein
MKRLMIVGVLLLMVAVSAGRTRTISAAAPARAVDLAVPGRQNATASIAASGPFVVVAWGASTADGVTSVVAAVSRDAGRTFGAPVRVDRAGSDVRLSGEQPPRVSLVSRSGHAPTVVIVWTAKASAGTQLVAARSDDGGRSFGRPTVVPGSDAAGNRGWESAAADAAGHVVVAWLDHRGLVPAASGPASHPAAVMPAAMDGTAMAQLSKLYVAGVDGVVHPVAVTGGVCYCCRTALATGPDGAIYIAWRHVYPGDNRDIAFTVSRDGGRTFVPPQRVSEDHWVLNGCPDNGPALAVGGDNEVHVVWPTLVRAATPHGESSLALFHAEARDGARFSPRQRIPTEGTPRHPWIASGPDGHLLIAWDEQVDGTLRVAMADAVPDEGGGLRFRRLAIGGLALGQYPVAVAAGGAWVVAWTGGSTTRSVIRVRRIGVD